MRLGFVGTGAIAEAIVVGLLGEGAPDMAVSLSPRGAAIAARLAKRFSQHVTVAASNQAVLDASDVVVVAVVPTVAHDVLRELRFRPDHLVLSLVATLAAKDIAPLAAPATRIVRAIPLPSAAERASPTPIMPPDPIAKDIFDRIGAAIETADPRAFDAMASASGIMAAYFGAAGAVSKWLSDRGLTPSEADAYIRTMLAGLAGTAASGHSGFEDLAKEHQTEGGLNEQFLLHMRAAGMGAAVRSGLDELLARIENAGSRSSN